MITQRMLDELHLAGENFATMIREDFMQAFMAERQQQQGMPAMPPQQGQPPPQQGMPAPMPPQMGMAPPQEPEEPMED